MRAHSSTFAIASQLQPSQRWQVVGIIVACMVFFCVLDLLWKRNARNTTPDLPLRFHREAYSGPREVLTTDGFTYLYDDAGDIDACMCPHHRDVLHEPCSRCADGDLDVTCEDERSDARSFGD